MIVRIVRATIALKRQVYPGEILDVSKVEGTQLISAGKAVVVSDAPVETTSAPVETAEAAVMPQAKPKSAAKRKE